MSGVGGCGIRHYDDPRLKAVHLSWLRQELSCLLLGPPGLNWWMSMCRMFSNVCNIVSVSLRVWVIVVFIIMLLFIRDD